MQACGLNLSKIVLTSRGMFNKYEMVLVRWSVYAPRDTITVKPYHNCEEHDYCAVLLPPDKLSRHSSLLQGATLLDLDHSGLLDKDKYPGYPYSGLYPEISSINSNYYSDGSRSSVLFNQVA